MQTHPAAEAFPMMDDKRFGELVADINEHGLREAITLCEGMVLDGRNRLKACDLLKIKPNTKNFDGDPWAYVWSLNGARRDLVADQRYLIWKFCHEKSEGWVEKQAAIQEEANRKRSEAMKGVPYAPDGEKRKPEKKVDVQTVQEPSPRREAKAALSNTNMGAVARGDALVEKRPDLAEKVRKGDVKPAEAYRQMKRDEVVQKNSELPTGKWGVIYADPPWKYADAQAVKGAFGTGTGAANCHYPSLSLSELKALPVPDIASANCVLWLWATCPLLEDALDLARAWRFSYKTQFVWDKVKHNMGNYNSVRHELLLICTRGSCLPEISKLFDSVQTIERTEHSCKPEEFRHIIETLYPSAKKIELFRRGETPDGWDAWGNEVETETDD